MAASGLGGTFIGASSAFMLRHITCEPCLNSRCLQQYPCDPLRLLPAWEAEFAPRCPTIRDVPRGPLDWHCLEPGSPMLRVSTRQMRQATTPP
jgi:hypothetical protein